MVSAKNSYHGSLNPRAQFREAMTIEQVLASPMIAEPLTRPMCSPIGDGAAAVVIVSERKRRELGLTAPVRVRSSVLRSGWDHPSGSDGLSEVLTGIRPPSRVAPEATRPPPSPFGQRPIDS